MLIVRTRVCGTDTVRDLCLEDLSFELINTDPGLLLSRKGCAGCAMQPAFRVNRVMVVRFGYRESYFFG